MTYVVIKQAVYIHDVRGPFATVEAANGAAIDGASLDQDGHHTWDVHELTPDGLEGRGAKALARYAQRATSWRRDKHGHEVVYVDRAPGAQEGIW